MASVSHFLMIFLILHVRACPNNCYCKTDETFCQIVNCQSPIHLENTLTVKIKGELCETHKQLLTVKPNSLEIILADDYCGEITHCRYVCRTELHVNLFCDKKMIKSCKEKSFLYCRSLLPPVTTSSFKWPPIILPIAGDGRHQMDANVTTTMSTEKGKWW